MNTDKRYPTLGRKCLHTVQHECISSGLYSQCRHECHSGAAKRRCPTFNRVDIWKPCGFSVSPPGQMIFRWLFITTCRDATPVSSIIGKGWQKVRCWWGPTTVGEHCWWARFISSQLSGSYRYFIDLWLRHHTWGFQEVIYYYTLSRKPRCGSSQIVLFIIFQWLACLNILY